MMFKWNFEGTTVLKKKKLIPISELMILKWYFEGTIEEEKVESEIWSEDSTMVFWKKTIEK